MYILEDNANNRFMRKNIVWKILIYFIIYSIMGFFLETIFAILTKGTFESRQSFLYGPFCMVYGIGAICLIFTLNKYKNNTFKLFVYGMIVGATVEYFTSYFGELIMHIKWWDYSNAFMNIHGRTCLFYAICWGILSIPLIKYINPKLDQIIEKITRKIPVNFLKTCITFGCIFLFIDAIISVYALDIFLSRISTDYNINMVGVQKEYKDNKFSKILFSNEKIMLTYPNMMVVNENKEIIEVGKILKDIPNYYYKFGNK